VVLVLGIMSVSWFGLARHEVEVVGTIQAGMPKLSLPRVGEEDLADIFMGAIGIVLVLVAETLAAGRTFAAKHNYEIVPNRELFAMGAANLASGLFGGMIVGGGMSGTAANDAGGRTHTVLHYSGVGVGGTDSSVSPASISQLAGSRVGGDRRPCSCAPCRC
jgi:MFS superfamily sulfate permease-like transporter